MQWNTLHTTMETYCVSCKKILRRKSNDTRTRQKGLILVSNCAVYGKEKSRFVKNPASGLELH